MGEYCLSVELHQEGFAINGATPLSLHVGILDEIAFNSGEFELIDHVGILFLTEQLSLSS